MEYNKREEVSENYKWDLTTRYKNDEYWEKDCKKITKDIKDIEKYKGTLTKSAENLYNALEDMYKLENKISKVYVYAMLKHDEDLKNAKYSMYYNKAYNIYNSFITAISFIRPELLKTSKTNLSKLIKNDILNKYKFLLEKTLRMKEHTLTESEELLVSKLTKNDNVFDNLSSVLIDSTLNFGKININGEETLLTNSNYRNILTNKNRNVRKKAFDQMSTKIKEFSSIFGETLIANMKNTSTLAEIYKYKNTLDMELFESNIPEEVVTNLYKVVNKNLSIFQKYLILLKNNIGLETLEFYDLNTEFLNDTMTFSIEDTENLILEATKIYGKEYHDIIEKAFKERWIDYASYKGKKSGAYSTSNYGNTPVVLANYHGKFTDVSTIAHELGHAVNFYLSQKYNESHECDNDIFVAEVASLTNEIILSNYIVTHSNNKNLKLIAIYNLIDIIQNNLFDACLEGELENEMYKLIDNNEEINDEMLSDCIFNLRKKYYGNVVNLDEKVRYLWARRSHYYYPYYLFKYATGVSSAIYVATKIISNQDDMKEKYIEFLKSGSRDYPVNLLNNLGIDVTKPIYIENAIKYFDYLVELFKKVSEE